MINTHTYITHSLSIIKIKINIIWQENIYIEHINQMKGYNFHQYFSLLDILLIWNVGRLSNGYLLIRILYLINIIYIYMMANYISTIS